MKRVASTTLRVKSADITGYANELDNIASTKGQKVNIIRTASMASGLNNIGLLGEDEDEDSDTYVPTPTENIAPSIPKMIPLLQIPSNIRIALRKNARRN